MDTERGIPPREFKMLAVAKLTTRKILIILKVDIARAPSISADDFRGLSLNQQGISSCYTIKN
jgi:hypothetical protein